MSNKLRQILSDIERKQFATDAGTKAHKKMQNISIKNADSATDEFQKRLSENKELSAMFNTDSKTEVPIAGRINGRFVSRRIDRLFVDNEQKKVYVLDYKTDVDKATFKDKYVYQIQEYVTLLHDIYPEYKISGFILWLSDFSLEKIV